MGNATCSIYECEAPVDCRGLCPRHYADLLRRTSERKRLRPHVRLAHAIDNAVSPEDCWLWDGPVDAWGYARVRDTMAHRWVYEVIIGPIPPGYQLDHICHDPDVCTEGRTCTHRRCVNPFHLVAVVPRINALRSTAPTAINAMKTACIAGHPLSGDNLYVQRSTGKRYCRTCQRRRRDAYLARKRNEPEPASW